MPGFLKYGHINFVKCRDHILAACYKGWTCEKHDRGFVPFWWQLVLLNVWNLVSIDHASSIHVQMIVDAPPLKEGNGKELRQLHDTMQQHVCALRTPGCELPGKFTSMIELKLGFDTLFEWQKHSQANSEVPRYQDLLDFIDLRAQVSETSCTSQNKRQPWNDQHVRRSQGKTVTTFATSSHPVDNSCVICKTEKHPLYVCKNFKSMSNNDKVSVLKSNGLCMNCLGSGHFKQQCKSIHSARSVKGHTIYSYTY